MSSTTDRTFIPKQKEQMIKKEETEAKSGNNRPTITNVAPTPSPSPPRPSCVIELSNHNFQPHTFHVPTYCDICQALLTGLFKQGLQCQICGLNVHTDDKNGEHDCRAKAMLKPCKAEDALSPEEQERIRYEELVATVNEEIKEDNDREQGEKISKNVVKEDSSQSKETNETEKERDSTRKHPTDSSFLPRVSRLLPTDFVENAHSFEVVSFKEPTRCSVCDGILAGMFSQGKQCKNCGLTVHHGAGAGDHSNCHAEAMVKPCPMTKVSVSTSDAPKHEEQDGVEKQGTSSMLTGMISTSLPSPSGILATVSSEAVEEEKPHKFVEHSYAAPTYCSVCNGLLVGLWSQGFQCGVCGMNVHRGEGIDGHDDCKGEARLASCPGEWVEPDRTVTLREAIEKSPNFLREVKEQIDKDMMTHVKGAVVEAGVEGERSKNFRRLQERIVPIVDALDKLEARGEAYSLFVLLRLHIIITFIVSIIGILLFIIALSPKLGFGILDADIFQLVVIHELTILGTIHVFLVVIAFLLRYYSMLFRRKSVIIEEYLTDMFGINAEEDFGVSVVGASIRARAWSQRIAISATITCVSALLAWNAMQPTLDELRRALGKDFESHLQVPAEEYLLSSEEL